MGAVLAPGPIRPTAHHPGRRHVSFSPSQLRAYCDCPERYFRKYIAHERMPAPFHRGTLRGSAVHKTLADAFRRRQAGELVDEVERPVAERFLPRASYQKAATADAWAADIDEVVKLAGAGLRAVPEQATILDVERSFAYVRSTRSRIPGAKLVGHVDLVIQHRDGIVEQIELKTGWAQPDPYQEVICRIGVCEAYNGLGMPVLSSTIQLSTGDEYALDGDRDVLVAVLDEIERTVVGIWEATEWPARENARCAFCEFATTLCSIRGEWGRSSRE
jgi:hypothetical protein